MNQQSYKILCDTLEQIASLSIHSKRSKAPSLHRSLHLDATYLHLLLQPNASLYGLYKEQAHAYSILLYLYQTSFVYTPYKNLLLFKV